MGTMRCKSGTKCCNMGTNSGFTVYFLTTIFMLFRLYNC
jgi:hypothetical protein